MDENVLIEWDDDTYSTGMKLIDDQHKILVGLINALHQNRSNPNKEFIEKILNTLVEYTQTHFKDEENILKKINFKEFESHCRQHRHFIETIQKFVKNYQQLGRTPELLDEITDFLKNWLVSHILIQDRNYANYLFGE